VGYARGGVRSLYIASVGFGYGAPVGFGYGAPVVNP
jgi:hypothetical protein